MADVEDVLRSQSWDLAILHPPCQFLAHSGLHWNKRVEGRSQSTRDALAFARRLMDAPVYMLCIENPRSAINRIRMPDQTVQPYMFGDDASKATCLWLKNLPLLEPTRWVAPRIVNGKRRWANQRDDGQNNVTLASEDRTAERSRTYPGIAEAMAKQWGSLLK